MTTYKPYPDFIKKTPAERRKAWADALRSGKYRQGSEYLFHDNFYCCLGVLAHAVDDVAHYDLRDMQLLDGYNPIVAYDDVTSWETPWSATELNDEKGLTFHQIADLIEGKEVMV